MLDVDDAGLAGSGARGDACGPAEAVVGGGDDGQRVYLAGGGSVRLDEDAPFLDLLLIFVGKNTQSSLARLDRLAHVFTCRHIRLGAACEITCLLRQFAQLAEEGGEPVLM